MISNLVLLCLGLLAFYSKCTRRLLLIIIANGMENNCHRTGIPFALTLLWKKWVVFHRNGKNFHRKPETSFFKLGYCLKAYRHTVPLFNIATLTFKAICYHFISTCMSILPSSTHLPWLSIPCLHQSKEIHTSYQL